MLIASSQLEPQKKLDIRLGIGAYVGRFVGDCVGLLVGICSEGSPLGGLVTVGMGVGPIVSVGCNVGNSLGDCVGRLVGGGVGVCVLASHDVPKKQI